MRRAWGVIAIIATLLGAPVDGTGGDPCPPHPHPCSDGSHWPLGDARGFAALPPEHLPLTTPDGITLDGWVWRPDVGPHVTVPTILTTTPYASHCIPASGLVGPPNCLYGLASSSFVQSNFWRTHRLSELVDAGYAIAVYSVRGTGNSGGCFELLGPQERLDHVDIIRHLAGLEWSNGRVGMWGLSYMGSTPWLAAVEAPDALKTIVTAGSVPDLYRAVATPQGAMYRLSGTWYASYTASLGFAPPAAGLIPDLVPWAAGRGTDPCPDTLVATTAPPSSQALPHRARDFYEERRMKTRLAAVSAATWIVHGFQDSLAHAFQDDPLWDLLPQGTPKRMLLGQWGHTVEFDDAMSGHPAGRVFTEQLLHWFDYWLKGLGAPPSLGVQYQDDLMQWHGATEWPPGGDGTVLNMVADDLSATPGSGTQQVWTAPVGERAPTCDATSSTGRPTSIGFLTGPLQAALLAGNPRVDLVIESDLPGGTLAADLYAMGPDYDCGQTEPGTAGRPVGLRHLARGAVDLRYADGDYDAEAFPTASPTAIHIDLTAVSARLAEGDMLGVTLTGAGSWTAHGGGYFPTIVLHEEGSRLVLPLRALD